MPEPLKLKSAPPAAIPAEPNPIALEPLAVRGVVVEKAALIRALQVYVPQLEDLAAFEDGERFLLTLRTEVPGA